MLVVYAPHPDMSRGLWDDELGKFCLFCSLECSSVSQMQGGTADAM